MIVYAQYEDQTHIYKIPLRKILRLANIELTEAEIEALIKEAIISQ